jgi:hypothetical protein
MKRASGFALFLLGFASLGFGQSPSDPAAPSPRFSLKVGGGGGYATLGDFGLGVKGQFDYLKDEYGDVKGTYEAPHWGAAAGGEIICRIGGRLSVGLGSGYIRHATASQVTYVLGFIDVKERINPRLTVIPIELSLHLQLPLGRVFSLDLYAGPGYYLGTLDYEYRMDLSLLGLDGYDVYTFSSRRGAVGFQGGLGLEMALGSRLALVLNIGGRYARLVDFKGDWTEEGGGDFWDYSDNGSGDGMWYYAWTYNAKKYDQVAFQAERPTGSLVSDVRPARVDLTGFCLTLGLKIKLF